MSKIKCTYLFLPLILLSGFTLIMFYLSFIPLWGEEGDGIVRTLGGCLKTQFPLTPLPGHLEVEREEVTTAQL